jgi:hypothetical protein
MSLLTAADRGAEGVSRHRRATPPAYPHGRVHDGVAHDTIGGDTQAWLRALHGPPAIRHVAVAELHTLLLRGAHHELARRRHMLTHIPGDELQDLATQAADDALVAILAKLDTFRGASRFTTWRKLRAALADVGHTLEDHGHTGAGA